MSSNVFEDYQRALVCAILASNGENVDKVLSIIDSGYIKSPTIRVIFESISHLSRESVTPSPVNVIEDLRSKALLSQVGGAETIHMMVSDGERALLEAPVTTYAKIVKEYSIRYDVQLSLKDYSNKAGEDSGVPLADVMAGVQSTMSELQLKSSDSSTSVTTHDFADSYKVILQERTEAQKEGLQGIPSMFPTLDKNTGGFQPGQFITVGARTGIGKALHVDTPILTRRGWVTMGEITVLDYVLSTDNLWYRVSDTSDVMHNHDCYKVSFASLPEGSDIIADAEHVWDVQTSDGRLMSATTFEIREMILRGETVSIKEFSYYPADKYFPLNHIASYPSTPSKELLDWWEHRLDDFNTSEIIMIESITPVDSVPVRCISVTSPDRLYLAGYGLVPTHNSVFAVMTAVSAAKFNKSVLFFSLEMGKTEIVDRIVANISGVSLSDLKNGTYVRDTESLDKVNKAIDEIRNMKVTIDVDPHVSIDVIKAKATELAQSPEGLDMVIVDYLQLVQPPSGLSNRQEQVSALSRNLKLLAKELGIPIMVLVQLNREGSKDDEDKLPSLKDIRESHGPAQDSDMVIIIHRNAKEITDGEVTPKTLVILDKNRNGPANIHIPCTTLLATSNLEEIPKKRKVDTTADEDVFNEISDDEVDAIDSLDSDDSFDDLDPWNDL